MSCFKGLWLGATLINVVIFNNLLSNVIVDCKIDEVFDDCPTIKVKYYIKSTDFYINKTIDSDDCPTTIMQNEIGSELSCNFSNTDIKVVSKIGWALGFIIQIV